MRIKPATNLTGLMRVNYPQVYRIAIALAGNATSANKIARRVLRRSVKMSNSWDTDDDAARWFARFTVLNSRAFAASKPKHDLLFSVTHRPEIIAVIHAIRQLPMQQREAFLLHHGQCMDLRPLATAMDCSTNAAASHLAAATKAIRQLAAEGLGDFTLELPRMLAQLIPPPIDLEMHIQQALLRRRVSSTIKYLLLWPAAFALLAILAWEAYRLWQMIVI